MIFSIKLSIYLYFHGRFSDINACAFEVWWSSSVSYMKTNNLSFQKIKAVTTFLFKSAAHCFLVINILFKSPKLRIRNTTLKRRCNNINGYINLTWYKWHSQRKIYHQAIKFQISKCIIIACFCFNCRMFFHVTLDRTLNFDYTQWNMWRYQRWNF